MRSSVLWSAYQRHAHLTAIKPMRPSNRWVGAVVAGASLWLLACTPQTGEVIDARPVAQRVHPTNRDADIDHDNPIAASGPLAPLPERGVRGDEGHRIGPISLQQLESLALEHNPTLTQASAHVAAAQAQALQAGLYPNPNVGYVGEQIGVEGTAGEFQGGFIRQEIVTAGKLRLSRDKYQARASVAEQHALAQRYRVLNDVRTHYYRALGARARVAIEANLLKTAEDNLLTVQEMLNVGQANKADLHQAKVMRHEQQLNVQMAENALEMAWETLMAVVGVDRPLMPLADTLEGKITRLAWKAALDRLLAESPELGAARAKLAADQITVQREKVEPIPNIVVEGSAGYNFEARETVYGAGVQVEVPLFDRNQGTIQQAKADLMRQRAQLRLTELRLRRTLADQYRRYKTALQHVTDFQNVILPQSKQRYVTQLQSYQADRESWPAVLEAQTDFFKLRLNYIDRLVQWREAEVAINGLLLVSGLEAAPGVPPPGHIDAVPKPR